MDSLACFVKAQRLHWGYLIKYSNFFFFKPRSSKSHPTSGQPPPASTYAQSSILSFVETHTSNNLPPRSRVSTARGNLFLKKIPPWRICLVIFRLIYKGSPNPQG
jgi:hypothetical protein